MLLDEERTALPSKSQPVTDENDSREDTATTTTDITSRLFQLGLAEEEDDDNSLETPNHSPHTPLYPSKSSMKRQGSSSNLMDHAAQAAAALDQQQDQEDGDDIKPLLSSSSLSSPPSTQKKKHETRPSFLDQFPLLDDDDQEDNPLFLDDDDANNSPQNVFSSHQEEDGQMHPLLRKRHAAKSNDNHPLQHSTLLSNLHVPQEKQQQESQHHKTKSMIEEEMDYYPQPDDFPTSPSRPMASINLTPGTPNSTIASEQQQPPPPLPSLNFTPYYTVTIYLQKLSSKIMPAHQYTAANNNNNNATWIGFWAMFLVTCSNYVLMPMRDAIALAVGVEHIPKLTLASTVMAFGSSVPIGWLFEAPDPARRNLLTTTLGLTRGETQGTSLALFYRFFALSLWSYAIGFLAIEGIQSFLGVGQDDEGGDNTATGNDGDWMTNAAKIGSVYVGKSMYIAFFLVVHLCKLHSLSLVWGVTTEAMEYEETERKRQLVKQQREQQEASERDPNYIGNNVASNTGGSKEPSSGKLRLQRLAFVGFGGTVGGILGSILASTLARYLRLSGLLVVSALMLEAAAQLAIELGRIMQAHWLHQQMFPSTDNLATLDPSMKRSASLGSMKRISSGNSLSRVKSMSELKRNSATGSTSSSLQSLEQRQRELEETIRLEEAPPAVDSFSQRLLRGIRTISQSRLLMAIFTYNALYASTTTLLSFQRAELVANRMKDISNESNTAFLANVNMASSVAVFALQASGVGAYIAHLCGPRGTLALMPIVRLVGVALLAYWHQTSDGEPPNLLLFLMLDECCRVMNMAVAKPVRESLWRGLSNEARYEAKPIVDTLANRWGGGSAAFLVSSINQLLDLFGVAQAKSGEVRVVFGFPPSLLLCMIVAAWWAGVSADLGQIRKRIDVELKKMQ